MLEYFAYKKVKKHKAEKEAKEEARRLESTTGHDQDGGRALSPVLDPEDESFLAELLASEDGPPPPLPPRRLAAELDWTLDDDAAAAASGPKKGEAAAATGPKKGEAAAASGPKKGEAAASRPKKGEAERRPQQPQMKSNEGASTAPPAADKKPGRLALLFTRNRKNEEGLKPKSSVPAAEGEREKQDLGHVLDQLNLCARNNKVMSTESSELLQRFSQVFKDLVNGVPTACNDLTRLVEDRDGALSRGFDKLPASLKRLVTQLPDKVVGSLAPEILAAAASSQGIKTDPAGGLKGTAKKILLPHNLAELVTKPGAVVGMLRAIVEVLKTRWPAFIGMNVLWSVALSLLLFVLWYCHKRGREVRLEGEKVAAAVDGSDRIEELPDDPSLPGPEAKAPAPAPAKEPSQPSKRRGQ